MPGVGGNWRKASFSEAANCLEAADWRKSRHSQPGGNCVEVASGILVRDTTDRDGVTLELSGVSWGKFLETLR